MSQPNGEPVVQPGNEPQNAPETEPKNEPAKLTYEQMEKELQKVRSEAAARRVALREQEEAAKKWAEYEESQKTELQKLQDAVAERDKRLADKELEVTRARIAKKYSVADEDLDLLVGDEASMTRLAEKLGKGESQGSSSPVDLLAGNRGKPLGSKAPEGNSFMDALIRGNK